jgi:hypothetical protein
MAVRESLVVESTYNISGTDDGYEAIIATD